jgi:TolB-like protein/Tfp pilus assembly protein PilF
MRLRQLLVELRRRKVFRASALYIVAAWGTIQVADLLFPALGVPEEAIRYVWLIVAFLFPLALIFAWRYDVSLDGLTRTPPTSPGDDFDPSLRRTDLVLLAALSVVAVAVVFEFATRIEPGTVRLDESISAFSIAVLPFDDLSGNPDEQYFVSGMQSALIDGLSRVRNLRVTSKVSTLPYRETGGQILDIALQLGVARVIEGTVLRDGNRVSIALRMHDVEKDAQVWSDRFEDELENILILQARAAQEIANQVRVQLGPEEREVFSAKSPVNAEAYQAYLKGVFHVERLNPEDIRTAAVHFQRAVEIDPEFALGHWGMAKLCEFRAQMGMLTPQQARETCIVPMLRALELDPLLPEAHLGLAIRSTYQLFDWESARQHFERAIELNPSFADAHMLYAHYLGIIGEMDTSTRHAEQSVELDPLNPFVIAFYGVQAVMRRDYDEAIAAGERSLTMAPGYTFGYTALWMARYGLGRREDAVNTIAKMMRANGRIEYATFLEEALQQNGPGAAALQLAKYLEASTNPDSKEPVRLGMLYMVGEDFDSAIDWFEIAVEQLNPNVPYVGVNAHNPGLRAHPRFAPLMERLGLDYWASHP